MFTSPIGLWPQKAPHGDGLYTITDSPTIFILGKSKRNIAAFTVGLVNDFKSYQNQNTSQDTVFQFIG